MKSFATSRSFHEQKPGGIAAIVILALCLIPVTARPVHAGFTAAQHVARAVQLKQSGDLPGARKELEAALEADPQSASAHYALGWIQIAQGDKTGAANSFRTAIQNGLPAADRAEAEQALTRLGAAPAASPPTVKTPAASPRAKSIPATPAVVTPGAASTGNGTDTNETAPAAVNQKLLQHVADHMEKRKVTPAAFWRRAAFVTVPMAMVWFVCALLMTLATGQKMGRFDAILIACGVGAWQAPRFAQFFFHMSAAAAVSVDTVVLVVGVVFDVVSLFYIARRVALKRRTSKTGLLAWCLGWSAPACLLMASSAPVPGVLQLAGILCAAGTAYISRHLIYSMVLSQVYSALPKKEVATLEKRLRGELSPLRRFADNVRLSDAYGKVGDYVQAAAAARAALQDADPYPKAAVLAHAKLAQALIHVGDFNAALDECIHLFTIPPGTEIIESRTVWSTLGHGLLTALNFARGWLDEAATQANHTLNSLPAAGANNVLLHSAAKTAHICLAFLALEEENAEAARLQVRQASALDPKPDDLAEIRAARAGIALLRGDKDRALEHGQRALQTFHYSVSAHYWMFRIQRDREDTAAAAEHLQTLQERAPHHFYTQKAIALSEGHEVPTPQFTLPSAPADDAQFDMPEIGFDPVV